MKIMNTTFLLVVVLLSVNVLFGQNKEMSKMEDIPLKAEKFIGIDKFNNLYYIRENTLFKKSEVGEAIAFKDVLLGDVDRVDILNPNKIIIFYKMSNTVVLLDNRMTEIDRQDFNRVSPFKNIGFAGTSKDQGLWIYNIDLNQIELYDYRYDKSIAVSLPIDDEILNMKNNFNFCFLETPQGISVFNIYGSLVKKINIENIVYFDLNKNKLIVHTTKELKLFNEDFELWDSLSFNEDNYENFFYKDENLYLYDGNFISRYSIISKN